MYRAKWNGQYYTVDEFRQSVGSDYDAHTHQLHCPDCDAQVAIHNDGGLPQYTSLFSRAGRAITAHFAHYPGQASPDCRYLSHGLEPRDYAISSGIEKDPRKPSEVRRKFMTSEGVLVQAGYQAGFMMAAMIGSKRQIGKFDGVFDNPQRMVETGLIPPASSKLWSRKSPDWARPFTWILYHDFAMAGRYGKNYTVQFRLYVPEGSVLDDQGQWRGKPATIYKVFKDTGRSFKDHEGKPVQFPVTEEQAYLLSIQAQHWGEHRRPFPHVRLARLFPHSLFPKVTPILEMT